MFRSKPKTQPKRSSGAGTAMMQQMGFQIPNFDDPNIGPDGDDDDDEDALQAELQRMQQDTVEHVPKRQKANQRKPGGSAQDLHSFHTDVNKILNDLDRPINDDELSDGDEGELLAELNEISGDMEADNDVQRSEPKQASSTLNSNIVSVLEARREMYVKALATAKTAGDASKVRRFDRQLKSIQDLLQSARAGAPVNEEDIPPSLVVGEPTPAPSSLVSQKASPPSVHSQRGSLAATAPSLAPNRTIEEKIARLKSRALEAKNAGDMVKAKEYIIQLKKVQSESAGASMPPPVAPVQQPQQMQDAEPEERNSVTVPEPRTIMEALQQQHEELVKRHQDALSKGESSKARRLERLCKQYEEAMDATRKGRPFDYNELPTLAGFAPIPVPPSSAPPTSSASLSNTGSTSTSTRTTPSSTLPRPSPTLNHRVVQPTAPVPAAVTRASTNTKPDQQLSTLRLQHEKLKRLALHAKQQGDNETAKKHLIACKGVEEMISSIESGSSSEQVPDVPADGFEVILDDELTQELAQCDRETIYRRTQEDLLRQMQLCARNQQMYAQMEGAANVKHAAEFKALEQRCARDLEKLRAGFQHGSKAPVFHYEKRSMHLIHVNNDLSENDLEVNVLRGINLPVPAGYTSKSLETNVIIDFPYPTEAPQTARTRHAVGSGNAEYPDSSHRFQIKRNDGKFKRSINRKELKLSIFYKVGFLRSDRLLGVASIKLAGLEHSSTIHESVDVYDSEHKKKIEGKLEIKLRVKEALGQSKAAELSSQRWLVIDRFEDIPHNAKASQSSTTFAAAPSITALASLVPTGDALGLLAINLAQTDDTGDASQPRDAQAKKDARRASESQATAAAVVGPQSVRVLEYEADLLEDQIEKLEEHLSPDQIEQLRKKLLALKNDADRIRQTLKQGGGPAVQEHIRGLEILLENYDKDARECHEAKKRDLFLSKKKLVMQEIKIFTEPLP